MLLVAPVGFVVVWHGVPVGIDPVGSIGSVVVEIVVSSVSADSVVVLVLFISTLIVSFKIFSSII